MQQGDRVNVYCTGCSYTRRWPSYLSRVDARWSWHDGCGLWALETAVRDESGNADRVVVQLPTPLRSFYSGPGWACRTRDLFLAFRASFPLSNEERASTVLLEAYRKEILRINSLRSGITFFEFNTGGYPFRCGHDFGSRCSTEMAEWAKANELDWLVLDLSGVPGMCLQEQSGEPESDEWTVIHPQGVTVIDPHPSEAAQTLAAQTVEDHLCGGA